MKKTILTLSILSIVGIGAYSYFHSENEENNIVSTNNAKGTKTEEKSPDENIKNDILVDPNTNTKIILPYNKEMLKLAKEKEKQGELLSRTNKKNNDSSKEENIQYENEQPVTPYEEISEHKVGWDVQTVDAVNDLNIAITNYLPIKMKKSKGFLEDIQSGRVKKMNFIHLDQNEERVFEKCETKKSKHSVSTGLLCKNGNGDGHLIFSIYPDKIEGYFSFNGSKQFIKTENGMGYIYNVKN